jgi:hypothetical protein
MEPDHFPRINVNFGTVQSSGVCFRPTSDFAPTVLERPADPVGFEHEVKTRVEVLCD